MRKVFFVLLLLAGIAAGCKKEENKPVQLPCERDQTAIIVITNNSANPYALFVDGFERASIPGGAQRTYSISAGGRQLRAVQQSGYLLYPSVFEAAPYFKACEKKYWSFP